MSCNLLIGILSTIVLICALSILGASFLPWLQIEFTHETEYKDVDVAHENLSMHRRILATRSLIMQCSTSYTYPEYICETYFSRTSNGFESYECASLFLNVIAVILCILALGFLVSASLRSYDARTDETVSVLLTAAAGVIDIVSLIYYAYSLPRHHIFHVTYGHGFYLTILPGVLLPVTAMIGVHLLCLQQTKHLNQHHPIRNTSEADFVFPDADDFEDDSVYFSTARIQPGREQSSPRMRRFKCTLPFYSSNGNVRYMCLSAATTDGSV